MLRDGAVCWQEFVGISGETAVPGDEPSHLWLERGAHQEHDPYNLEDGDSILSKI